MEALIRHSWNHLSDTHGITYHRPMESLIIDPWSHLESLGALGLAEPHLPHPATVLLHLPSISPLLRRCAGLWKNKCRALLPKELYSTTGAFAGRHWFPKMQHPQGSWPRSSVVRPAWHPPQSHVRLWVRSPLGQRPKLDGSSSGILRASPLAISSS